VPGNVSRGAAAAGLLEASGGDITLGIPSAHTLERYKGLIGPSMRHTLHRPQTSAGPMANAYGHSSGRPGACVVMAGRGGEKRPAGVR